MTDEDGRQLNCMEMEVQAADGAGTFTLTIQRRGGKTPMQLKAEADARSERLEQALWTLREALRPFAEVADLYDDREDDDHEIWADRGTRSFAVPPSAFQLATYRRARQAYQTLPGSDGSKLRCALVKAATDLDLMANSIACGGSISADYAVNAARSARNVLATTAAPADAFLDYQAAFLVALAQAGVPADVQELLVHGNARNGIPAGALARAITVMGQPDRAASNQHEKRLVEIVGELTRALTGLTPGGSEYFKRWGDIFYADAERCTAVVREQFEAGQRERLELMRHQRATGGTSAEDNRQDG